MREDPIVAEVRKIRDAYAARYNYDLRAMYQALKEQENEDAREKVSFPPRPASLTRKVKKLADS